MDFASADGTGLAALGVMLVLTLAATLAAIVKLARRNRQVPPI